MRFQERASLINCYSAISIEQIVFMLKQDPSVSKPALEAIAVFEYLLDNAFSDRTNQDFIEVKRQNLTHLYQQIQLATAPHFPDSKSVLELLKNSCLYQFEASRVGKDRFLRGNPSEAEQQIVQFVSQTEAPREKSSLPKSSRSLSCEYFGSKCDSIGNNRVSEQTGRLYVIHRNTSFERLVERFSIREEEVRYEAICSYHRQIGRKWRINKCFQENSEWVRRIDLVASGCSLACEEQSAKQELNTAESAAVLSEAECSLGGVLLNAFRRLFRLEP